MKVAIIPAGTSDRAASVALAAIPTVEPAARIDDVVERMTTIIASLPSGDGIAAFTRLYLDVTEAVRSTAATDVFEDVAFIRWLDVVFANLYFGALRAAAAGTAPVPHAWAPLFDARETKGIVPLQFAVAGMNAHINRDLPVALVDTCEARGVDLKAGSPQQRDFLRINKLLAQTEAKVKRSFMTGVAGEVDAVLGQLDDVLAMWNVERAREAAWVNGEALWALRAIPQLRADFLDTLDRTIGFAGRGLLRPVLTASVAR